MTPSAPVTWNTTATRTRYDYTYDQAGRRGTSKQSGDAYTDFGGSTYYRFTYDSRSEITDATDYQGEDPTSTSSPQLSGRHHAFSYDSIGNRQTSSRTGSAGTPDNYYTNALNQYSSRTNNYTHTAGTVGNSTISVGVSGSNSAVASAVAQQGRYWDAQLLLNNGAAPASSSLTITATGTASGGGTIVTTDNSRTAYLPTASQSFTYDVDGNLIGDGVWSYTYDAENRLISMSTLSAATKGGYPNQSLDFQYDYANRRVQKHVKNTTAGTETWRRYLHDGDNLVAEFDAPSGTSCGNLLRSYTWGLDLSGTLTATGGVGALVQITDHSTSVAYIPTYDGNGNIASLLQAADGNGQTASTAVAKYEYTPFGELLRTEGTYALSNPWRFSTKFFDVETSLVYYGHRYYDPRNGRFINRDPIEEGGGLDLYGFCLNDPIDRWDVLGNNIANQNQSPRQERQESEKRTEAMEERLKKIAAAHGITASESAFKEAAEALVSVGADPSHLTQQDGQRAQGAVLANRGFAGAASFLPKNLSLLGMVSLTGGSNSTLVPAEESATATATTAPNGVLGRVWSAVKESVDLGLTAYSDAQEIEHRNLEAQLAADERDYGFAGSFLRETPILGQGADIYDFYNGETTSGRVYAPLEWGFKGLSVAGTATMMYGSVSSGLAVDGWTHSGLLKDTEIIIDENLSPRLSSRLLNEGYYAYTLKKGLTDAEIINYARQRSAAVMTNNTADFVRQNIPVISVPSRLQTPSSVLELIERLNAAKNVEITPGTVIKLK